MYGLTLHTEIPLTAHGEEQTAPAHILTSAQGRYFDGRHGTRSLWIYGTMIPGDERYGGSFEDTRQSILSVEEFRVYIACVNLCCFDYVRRNNKTALSKFLEFETSSF